MKVLIACEQSGVVRDAFIKQGHDAMSCDLEPGNDPWKHYQGDVLLHLFDGWDLMIAHPPCTHLCVSGAAWFGRKKKVQREALVFVKQLMDAPIEKICIENPVGIISTQIRKPDQIIQPWNFGDPFQKRTCLWLKNLPPLKLSHVDAPLFDMNPDKGEFYVAPDGRRAPAWYAKISGSKDRGKIRSKTFPGIAKAMAEQWG